jgi:hypothetical protein
MAQTIKLKRSSTSGAIPATSALELGEVAINTYDGKMFIKKNDGSESVVEIGGAGSSSTLTSSSATYEYVATSSQTTFSGSDVYSNTLAYDTGTPPKIQVFLNGILLDEGSSADYTATTGTSVVLTTGAATGDLIQITAYKSTANSPIGLTVTGNLGIDTQADISATATSTTSTSVATIDSFTATEFRSARYTVQVTNSTDSTYQITEILLIHNGTTPEITEYGSIHTGAAVEATFDADISSGNVRLRATPASGDTMAFKVVRHSIIV